MRAAIWNSDIPMTRGPVPALGLVGQELAALKKKKKTYFCIYNFMSDVLLQCLLQPTKFVNFLPDQIF